jgi:hypothetical protein
MTTTTERKRPKTRKPILREVCLVGDRSRRYVHLVYKEFENQDLRKTGSPEQVERLLGEF